MTRVGFYVVQTTDPGQRLQVAVRLAEKATKQNHRIFINTASEVEARQLDELLWSYRPSAFLPHALLCDDPSQRLVIGWGAEPQQHDDLLINLALAIPAFFSRFQRVAEVVTQDPAGLVASRKAWTFYKERGYQLEKHDLAVKKSAS